MTGLVLALAAVDEPDLRPELDPYDVTPGLVGFLVMFAIAGACILLFLSLTRHLRRSKRNEMLRARDTDAQAAPSDDGAAAPEDGTPEGGAPDDRSLDDGPDANERATGPRDA